MTRWCCCNFLLFWQCSCIYSGSPTRTWSLSCPTKLGLRTNTAYYSSELHGAGLSRGHQANVQHRWNQLLVLRRISNFAVLLAIVACAWRYGSMTLTSCISVWACLLRAESGLAVHTVAIVDFSTSAVAQWCNGQRSPTMPIAPCSLRGSGHPRRRSTLVHKARRSGSRENNQFSRLDPGMVLQANKHRRLVLLLNHPLQ